MVEIPIKHSSWYDKTVYPSLPRLSKRLAKQVTVLWNQISYLKWSTVTQMPTMQNLMNCHRVGKSGMLTMVAEWTTFIQFYIMDYMHTWTRYWLWLKFLSIALGFCTHSQFDDWLTPRKSLTMISFSIKMEIALMYVNNRVSAKIWYVCVRVVWWKHCFCLLFLLEFERHVWCLSPMYYVMLKLGSLKIVWYLSKSGCISFGAFPDTFHFQRR